MSTTILIQISGPFKNDKNIVKKIYMIYKNREESPLLEQKKFQLHFLLEIIKNNVHTQRRRLTT